MNTSFRGSDLSKYRNCPEVAVANMYYAISLREVGNLETGKMEWVRSVGRRASSLCALQLFLHLAPPHR